MSPHFFKGAWDIRIFSASACCRSQQNCSQFSSVQSLSCVWLFVIPWTAERQASLSVTSSQNLIKLMSFESVMPSSHLILCHPLLLPPLIFPSIRVFSNESVLHIGWPKYWSFSFSVKLPMNIQDWFPSGFTALISLLSKRLSRIFSNTLQFKSISFSALSFLHGSTLTSIHDYWKNHRFDYIDLVGKDMSLLFNMLSRLGYQDLFNLSMLSLTRKLWFYHNWRRHVYLSLLNHYLQQLGQGSNLDVHWQMNG